MMDYVLNGFWSTLFEMRFVSPKRCTTVREEMFFLFVELFQAINHEAICSSSSSSRRTRENVPSC